MGKRIILVAVNDAGRRIGVSHPNARIPEEVIQDLRRAHEEDGLGYRRLAAAFALSRDTVRKICRYERRWQMPTTWKRVVVDDEDG